MKSLLVALGLVLLVTPLTAQPIQQHPDNPRYLLYRGEPTLLVTSVEHYGAVVNRAFDYVPYLTTLQEDGLNYTRIFVGSYVENTESFGIDRNTLAPGPGDLIVPWARSDEPGYAGGGNRFDLERWDPAYFERLRGFVRAAEARGILVEVTFFSSTYTDANWRFSPLHPDNNVTLAEPQDRMRVHTLANGPLLAVQERLVRKVVRELNSFDNVIYEVQNEPWSDHTGQTIPRALPDSFDGPDWQRRVDLPSADARAWQRVIVGFITSEETRLPKRHLIAQNLCNIACEAGDVDPAVAILNFHYAIPEAVYRNDDVDRVLSFDESGFAGHEDVTYRKEAWHFLMAGGGIYNNLDYSFAVEYEDGTYATTASPGHGGAALRRQLRVLKTFLEALPFVRMQPDTTVQVQGPAQVRALSEAGQAYAVYLDGSGPVQVRLTMPPGAYRIVWIDPQTGEAVAEEAMAHTGGSYTLTSPAFSDDLALRIVRP